MQNKHICTFVKASPDTAFEPRWLSCSEGNEEQSRPPREPLQGQNTPDKPVYRWGVQIGSRGLALGRRINLDDRSPGA